MVVLKTLFQLQFPEIYTLYALTFLSTYHFYPGHSCAFPLVFLVQGGVGPGPKSTRQSRDHSLHVFLGHLMDISLRTGSLGRLRCIQSRDSEQTQMDGQQ